MKRISIQAVLLRALLSMAVALPLACGLLNPAGGDRDANESLDGPSTTGQDPDSVGSEGGLPVGFEGELFTVVSTGVVEIAADIQLELDDNEQTLTLTSAALGVTESIDCKCPPTLSGGCSPDAGGCRIDIDGSGKADCVGGCDGSSVTCPSCDWGNLTTSPGVNVVGEALS